MLKRILLDLFISLWIVFHQWLFEELCKKGDWIIFARYAGSRIKIDGGEIRLLNDDEVLATVDNPKDIYHEF